MTLEGDIRLDKVLLSYVNFLAFVGSRMQAWAYRRDERAREAHRYEHRREKSTFSAVWSTTVARAPSTILSRIATRPIRKTETRAGPV